MTAFFRGMYLKKINFGNTQSDLRHNFRLDNHCTNDSAVSLRK